MAIKLNKNHSNLETIRRWVSGEKTDIKIFNNSPEKDKYREEGEEWKIKGVKYKKQNGVAVRITKTQGDIIREAIGNGLDCKICGAKYKFVGEKDRKFLGRNGMCMDCTIDYETKLRIIGAWDSYEKYKLSSYALGDLKNNREKLVEIVNYFTNNRGDVTLPSSDGIGNDAVWKNTNRVQILKDSTEDLQKVETLITEIEKVKKTNKKLYVQKCKEFKLKPYV